MKNRWGTNICEGISVSANHPHRGEITGVVVKIKREEGRGWVATLDSGYTVSIDDIREITP